jgi:iron(II)-dependent oxidoreductase
MNFVRYLLACTFLMLILTGNSLRAETDSALPKEVEINGVELVLIPAGWFTYTVPNGKRYEALPEGIPDYRYLRIWLDSYYMAKYEATARDLVRFLNSSGAEPALKERHLWSWTHGGEAEPQTGVGCTLRQDNKGRFLLADDSRQLPATYLSWNQANAFARWMRFRLPTEAEWQKAARGADARIWPWGDDYPDDTYALFGFGRECAPGDVDAYPKGRSPYGLYNMAGNVSEHVADWYNHRFDARLQDGDRNPPLAPEATERAPGISMRLRHGGSWSSAPHSYPIAYRRFDFPDRASNRHGVRFAVDATVVSALLAQGSATIIKPGQTK